MRFVRWFLIGAGVALGMAAIYRLVARNRHEDDSASAELDQAQVA